jgi:transposase
VWPFVWLIADVLHLYRQALVGHPGCTAKNHYSLLHTCARCGGYRVHTLICRGSGLPLFFLLSPANVHDTPFAQPLLAWAVYLYHISPRVIRLDAAYWGLRLIAWIHRILRAVAVIPWNPKRQKNRSCLPPTWTKEELGKRSSIERFFGRVFLLFACNVLLSLAGPP